MNNEASRKAFETFAVTVYKNIRLEKDDDEEYHYAHAAVGWKYWQASRKALEAEQAQQVAVPAGFAPMTNDEIKALMLVNGFAIKDGLIDLKPYVYQAVRAVEARHGIKAAPRGDKA